MGGGEHRFRLGFEDTPPRTTGKLLSLLSLLVAVFLLFSLKSVKKGIGNRE